MRMTNDNLTGSKLYNMHEDSLKNVRGALLGSKFLAGQSFPLTSFVIQVKISSCPRVSLKTFALAVSFTLLPY